MTTTKTKTLDLQLGFMFSGDKKELFLAVTLLVEDEIVPLALGPYMQFLYKQEGELNPKHLEFCYALAKIIKKVDIGGNYFYGVPKDDDMGFLFQKIAQYNIEATYRIGDELEQKLLVNEPLPIRLHLVQKRGQLVCSLVNHMVFIKNPLSWMVFEHNGVRSCFCHGVVVTPLTNKLDKFMGGYLDTDTLAFSQQKAPQFIKTIYEPFKDTLLWQVDADLSFFIPKETKVKPMLSLDYQEPVLIPTLFYTYRGAKVATDDLDDVVIDPKSGRKIKRNYEDEQLCQQELMEMFTQADLPFMLTNPGDIARFMRDIVPALKKRDWLIDSNVPDFNVIESDASIQFNVTSTTQNWFHYEPNANLNGQDMSLQEIARLMIDNQGFIPTKKGYVQLSDSTQKEIKYLAENGAFTVGKQFKQSEIMPMIMATRSKGVGDEANEMVDKLKTLSEIKPNAVGSDFDGELRDYQHHGFNWLQFLYQAGLGGVLADDMGLGKTVQVISFIATIKPDKPVLVVGPTAVIYNWESEVKKFYPKAKVMVYAGASRQNKATKLSSHDIIVTSFGVMKNDIALFNAIELSGIFVDEAQYIKNPQAQISKAIKSIHAPFKVAMTGTPIENHFFDLWNIFDFVMPDFLGNQKHFEVQVNDGQTQLIKDKIRPFILRREKKEVLTSLPEKTEIILKAPLSDTQAKLYKTILDATKKGIADSTGKTNKLAMLTALLKLRQVCLHPGLLKEFKGQTLESTKYKLFQDKLVELIDEGHKIVVFSQFTSMLDIIQEWVDSESIKSYRIDGGVTGKARFAAIESFQGSPDAGVFLVSLKAGGVGVNLTAADYVIHLDPWWNPAVEAQATDRVHRMGQKNKVIVYKMIAQGTIEEKIQELQQAKRELFAQVIDVDGIDEKSINLDEVKNLLLS